MNHLPIDKSKNPESIRLFKSDFLEFFTHIHPVTIVIVWGPMTVLLLYLAARTASLIVIIAAFALGLFLWTLAEYLLHRFLFHYGNYSAMSLRAVFWRPRSVPEG
jgi:hypothetical protein